MEPAKSDSAREKAYKIVAYSAVGFSLVAVLAVCITMPIVYNFVLHVQHQTKHELEMCKVSALASYFKIMVSFSVLI